MFIFWIRIDLKFNSCLEASADEAAVSLQESIAHISMPTSRIVEAVLVCANKVKRWKVVGGRWCQNSKCVADEYLIVNI